MLKGAKVLRYETVLEMLEDGPLPISDICLNLDDKFPKKHVIDVVSRMKDKGYVGETTNGMFEKRKELFFNEL